MNADGEVIRPLRRDPRDVGRRPLPDAGFTLAGDRRAGAARRGSNALARGDGLDERATSCGPPEVRWWSSMRRPAGSARWRPTRRTTRAGTSGGSRRTRCATSGEENLSPSLNRATFRLHARVDVQGDHVADLMHQGLASKRRVLQLPRGVHPRRGRRPPVPELGAGEPRCHVVPRGAPAISCDTFFYQFGSRYFQQYLDRGLADNAQPFQRGSGGGGSGRRPGSTCRSRAVGSFRTPHGRAEHPELFEDGNWQPFGDILTMTGAGNIAVTPLAARVGVRDDRERRVTCAGRTWSSRSRTRMANS